MRLGARCRRCLPGLALCAAVSTLAVSITRLEVLIFGRAWLEALVLAILLGTLLRSVWRPSSEFSAGITFTAKTLLELAVVFLGLLISTDSLVAAGPILICVIAGLVGLALISSYGIGRCFGISHKMALLIACGNAICGNSAIAAAAPVIDARGEDVAASIAFTAVLGVIVVLLLPFSVPLLGLNPRQFGILSGLTVYAVPQVIAATAPISAASVQIGTIVKLVRVLMLGPVLSCLWFMTPTNARRGCGAPWQRVVPPFIIGFLAMTTLRSAAVVPQLAITSAEIAANLLTVMAMAALGLGVDVRTVGRAGIRVTSAVIVSLLMLVGAALALIGLLGLS